MAEFLASDAVPAVILILIAAEALLLGAWHRRTGKGPSPLLMLSFLGAGFALVAALLLQRRAAAAPGPFAVALLAALLFHLWHLALLSRR